MSIATIESPQLTNPRERARVVRDVLAKHGITHRDAIAVFEQFVDVLQDNYDGDDESNAAVLASTMGEDDFDDIRESCSDREDSMVGRGRVRKWISWDTKTRRAKLTDAGVTAALDLLSAMGAKDRQS